MDKTVIAYQRIGSLRTQQYRVLTYLHAFAAIKYRPAYTLPYPEKCYDQPMYAAAHHPIGDFYLHFLVINIADKGAIINSITIHHYRLLIL
jgi:hypothetical protein